MTQISVQKELIRWARERSGLTPEALLKPFPKYELWERGEAAPTLRQLERLAKKTFTPLGYFFLPEPPEDKLPIPDFRTVGDKTVRRPSPNLLETVQSMQRRQGWMRDFLVEQGEEPLSFVGSVTLQDDATVVADRIRVLLGLSTHWARTRRTWTEALQSLRAATENARILIVSNSLVGNNSHRKLSVDEFRGFILSDEYAPLVFINSADAKGAQMFTLAHELAHLWLGRGGVFNLPNLQPANNNVEIFCNHVAAEFLVPAQELRAGWSEAVTSDEPFQTLARRFKVSPLVAARRALDLGFINKSGFLKFYRAYLNDERRRGATKSGGGDFYANQDMRIGRRFAEAVIRTAKEGRLLYREAYQLTGLRGRTFDEYAKSFGFESQV